MDYPGGIPSSKFKTGEQWDFPNVWSPSISLVIEALNGFTSTNGRQMAYNIAKQWVKSNYEAWRKYGQMFEKVKIFKLIHLVISTRWHQNYKSHVITFMIILKHSFVLFYPVQCRKNRWTRRGRRIHCAGNILSAKYIYVILVALILLTVEPILTKVFVSAAIKFWNLQWFSNRLWHQFNGKTRIPRKPFSIVFWTIVGHLNSSLAVDSSGAYPLTYFKHNH